MRFVYLFALSAIIPAAVLSLPVPSLTTRDANVVEARSIDVSGNLQARDDDPMSVE